MAHDAQETRVLFQGDSITDCGRDRSSVEPNTPAQLGTGYPLLVAADLLSRLPDRKLQFFNRGVGGDKIPDLQARWEEDTIAVAPDILTILVGVNDLWHRALHGYRGTVEDYEAGYLHLLEETRKRLPSTQIYVLEPFLLHGGSMDEHWFPEFDLRRAAAARIAVSAGAAFIPIQAEFDRRSRTGDASFWSSDGVHPTAAGHGLIAALWKTHVRL